MTWMIFHGSMPAGHPVMTANEREVLTERAEPLLARRAHQGHDRASKFLKDTPFSSAGRSASGGLSMRHRMSPLLGMLLCSCEIVTALRQYAGSG